MKEENRRSFVKKSLATSMTFTFGGLIRAHGEEGGSTTYATTVATTEDTTVQNPDETTVASTEATTDSGGTTTWDPDMTTLGTLPPEETTWNPDETTAPPTTEATTASSTWNLISETRTFEEKHHHGGPYDQEDACRLAGHTKLWQFLASNSTLQNPPPPNWGDTTGMTKLSPPSFQIVGVGYDPISFYQGTDGKWYYEINIPAITMTVIYWS
jgi:hypothetical protein